MRTGRVGSHQLWSLLGDQTRTAVRLVTEDRVRKRRLRTRLLVHGWELDGKRGSNSPVKARAVTQPSYFWVFIQNRISKDFFHTHVACNKIHSNSKLEAT